MIFEWETEEERLKRLMKYSAKEKLEWLREMHEFILKASSEEDKKIRIELREMR